MSDDAKRSDSPKALGRMLAGRYRIRSLIGEGGMAVVYEGEHVAIGKRVAIKIVQSLFAKDAEIIGRFDREARSTSVLESEHIVQVFDVGHDPDLGLFMVMELLKGEDLGHVLQRRKRLEPVFACGLVKQAALGLEKAHAAGVIHRDLKPANVFLCQRDDGSALVKLVDFGIAKVIHDANDATFAKKGITRRGTAIGTPQYMSPEQAQGLETVDRRSDVFSLGAVLFEAIAAQPHLPERPTYEQTILQLVSTPAPRLRSIVEVPQALDDLVADMLERDPGRRVPDMAGVRDRIDAVYPELRGASVKLKSLPPPSGPALERYAAQAHAAANPTLPATAAAIRASGIPAARRKSIARLAALAIVVGAVAGIALLRGATSTTTTAAPPLPPPASVTETIRVPPPPPAPAACASASVSAPPSSAAAASPNATASAHAAKPAAARTTQTTQAPQVGAAGISSTF